MSKTDRLYERLVLLENDLSDLLKAELRRCAAGKNDLLFLASEFKPATFPNGLSSQQTDRIMALVHEVCTLRAKLREPVEHTLAWQFRRACERWANVSNAHRLGARRLAEQLLAQMNTLC